MTPFDEAAADFSCQAEKSTSRAAMMPLFDDFAAGSAAEEAWACDAASSRRFIRACQPHFGVLPVAPLLVLTAYKQVIEILS